MRKKDLGLTPEEEAWLARSDERFVRMLRHVMRAEADLEARKQRRLDEEQRAEERRVRRRRRLLFWLPSRLRG